MKKGIYLGAGRALHPNYDIVYQDYNGKRDMGGDMLAVDLTPYDYIIATPPCNWWSAARGNRCSQYALDTKHLLPDIINKLIALGKPFIVENVKNRKRFTENGLMPRNDCYIKVIGRHTYWTNIDFNTDNIEQRQDFKHNHVVIKYDDMKDNYHQGGFNVAKVIDRFLETIHKQPIILTVGQAMEQVETWLDGELCDYVNLDLAIKWLKVIDQDINNGDNVRKYIYNPDNNMEIIVWKQKQ